MTPPGRPPPPLWLVVVGLVMLVVAFASILSRGADPVALAFPIVAIAAALVLRYALPQRRENEGRDFLILLAIWAVLVAAALVYGLSRGS